MIEVPERVKDALRSGDYRKEYEMKVFRHKEDFVYEINRAIFRESEQSTNFVGNTDLEITVAGDRYRIRIHKDSLWTEDPNFNQMILQWNYDGAGYYYPSYALHDEEGAYYEITAPTPIRQATITIKGVNRRMDSNWIRIDLYHYKEFDLEEITLNNSYLVSESVKFDERMCSDTELKFGLCEGTSLEFQYFNHINIRGCRIEVTLKAQYRDENNSLAWYPIPMGWYDVDECSRQASTGIIKAVAYNKLKSAYLDSEKPVKDIIEAGEYGIPGEVSIHTLLKDLLEDYAVEEAVSYIRTLDNSTYVVPTSFSFAAGTVYREYGGSYNYLRLWTTTVFFSLPEQNRDSIYRYTVNATGIYNAIKSRYNFNNIQIGTSDNHHTLTWLAEDYGAVDASGRADVKNINNVDFESFYPFAAYIVNPTSQFYSNNTGIYLTFCVGVDELEDATDPTGTLTTAQKIQNAQYILNNINVCVVQENVIPELEKVKVTINDIKSNVSIRELQSAAFEIDCKYGKLDRVTDMFSGITLNNDGLYPADSLYPNDALYPLGVAEKGFPAMYSKLWADEGNVRSFRYLIITYKAIEDGQEVEKKLQRTVNAKGTDNYNMSDNWLFRNLTWTAEQIGAYADSMVTKMRDIRWFPFEMWCAGLPYLEAGDAIEIAMKEGTYKSYVLRRNLNGIQNLQDEMINGTLDIF